MPPSIYDALCLSAASPDAANHPLPTPLRVNCDSAPYYAGQSPPAQPWRMDSTLTMLSVVCRIPLTGKTPELINLLPISGSIYVLARWAPHCFLLRGHACC